MPLGELTDAADKREAMAINPLVDTPQSFVTTGGEYKH